VNGFRRFYPTYFRCGGVSTCSRPHKITSSRHSGVNDRLSCCSQHPFPPLTTCQGLFDSLGKLRSARSAPPVAAQATPGGELLDTVGNATIIGESENPGDSLGRFFHRGCRDPSADQASVLPAGLARALASSATASLLSHPDVTEGFFAWGAGDGEGGGDAGVATESNCDEYARLVAEAYLQFPPRSQKQPPSSSSSLSSPPPLVQLQTDERLRFLRSLTELIEGAAEEIVCGMGLSGYDYRDAVHRMTNGLWQVASCELMPEANEADGEGDEEFR